MRQTKLNLIMALSGLCAAAISTAQSIVHRNAPTVPKTRREPSTKSTSRGYNTCTYFHPPHGGGAREVARRQRQLASGMLKVN